MGFLIFVIIILLAVGAWLFLSTKSNSSFKIPNIKDFILSKVGTPTKVAPSQVPIATTIVSPTEFRPATTIPVQLPPVFTIPEQPKIVNTPVMKVLKNSYPSVVDLAKDVDGYEYAVNLDGKQFHMGFGPAQNFITTPDGSVIAGTPPEETELTVEEEK